MDKVNLARTFINEYFMFKSIAKSFVIVVMLFAFIGQGTANDAEMCTMVDQSLVNTMPMDHAAMQHNSAMNHDAKVAMDDSIAAHDCCDDDCTCPVNACSSVAFVSSTVSSPKLHADTGVIPTKISIAFNPYHKSLFRPPIFA